MREFIQKHINIVLVLVLVGIVASPIVFMQMAYAAPTYTSNSYGVDEVFMGAGGANDMSSTTYRGRASLGDTGVGNSASGSYQSYGGFTTTSDPFIELIVNPVNTDLGYLSNTATSSTTTSFTVRTYLASGYVVVNGSNPPTSTSATTHTLNALTTPTAPSIGTEQFGINLVANTVPAGLSGTSANPAQLPDSTYSFGVAAAGYNTTNLYKYVKGDTIASSPSTSGNTQYTVSYIYNISDSTPAGEYKFNHIIIATSTY